MDGLADSSVPISPQSMTLWLFPGPLSPRLRLFGFKETEEWGKRRARKANIDINISICLGWQKNRQVLEK